jgi:hypothetical protein
VLGGPEIELTIYYSVIDIPWVFEPSSSQPHRIFSMMPQKTTGIDQGSDIKGAITADNVPGNLETKRP